MESINCMIVDDEPLARELLVSFSSRLPALRIVGEFGNALDARTFLQQNRVDLVFLDINMPVLDGIGLLTTLTRPPLAIMITAYKEYAVTAFELDVCDYLVKPFSFERFLIAVDRATTRLNSAKLAPENISNDTASLFLKTDGKIYRIAFDAILFTEASGNYTKIVTADNTLTPAISFSALEKMLPPGQFIKTHRSFIINKEKITVIEGNRIIIGTYETPIGRSYKDDFLARLKA